MKISLKHYCSQGDTLLTPLRKVPLAQGRVLRYTTNGTEWLPRMHCGLVPMADIIRQTLICPSQALSYTTQLVIKTTLSLHLCL